MTFDQKEPFKFSCFPWQIGKETIIVHLVGHIILRLYLVISHQIPSSVFIKDAVLLTIYIKELASKFLVLRTMILH